MSLDLPCPGQNSCCSATTQSTHPIIASEGRDVADLTAVTSHWTAVTSHCDTELLSHRTVTLNCCHIALWLWTAVTSHCYTELLWHRTVTALGHNRFVLSDPSVVEQQEGDIQNGKPSAGNLSTEIESTESNENNRRSHPKKNLTISSNQDLNNPKPMLHATCRFQLRPIGFWT